MFHSVSKSCIKACIDSRYLKFISSEILKFNSKLDLKFSVKSYYMCDYIDYIRLYTIIFVVAIQLRNLHLILKLVLIVIYITLNLFQMRYFDLNSEIDKSFSVESKLHM